MLQAIITDQDRVLYSLPVKHRGLGIPILYEISEIHYEHSKSISAPLSSVIIMQEFQIPESKIINEIKYSKKKESEQYDFSLNKTEFRDAILLRHGKESKGLPATCPCGQKYDIYMLVKKVLSRLDITT